MIRKYLIVFSCWMCLVQGFPPGGGQFEKVKFLQPATSFVSRTDEYQRQTIGSDLLFFSDFPQPSVPAREQQFGLWKSFHVTPDFSDGLAYPDPFLRTGPEVKRLAHYLYSKELFFDEIPHIRALLHNQQQRAENGVKPHVLGSLRPISPWYRFRDLQFHRNLF